MTRVLSRITAAIAAYRPPPLVLVAMALLAAGCHGEDSIMSEGNRTPDRSPPFSVSVDGEAFAHVSAAQRQQIEQDAIKRILAIVPAEHRKDAAAELERNPRPEAIGLPRDGQVAARQFTGSNNPEIARLLGTIASVRAADDHDNAMRAASTQVAGAPTARSVSSRVFVTVALNSSSEKSVAIVRPGRPAALLLLRPGADASELRAGIRTAAQLFRDFGANAEKELRAEVEVDDNAAPAPPQTERLLESLREAAFRDIPGVGRVRALEVVSYNK